MENSMMKIFSALRKINGEENLTVIVATHNPDLGSQTDRIIYLRDGKMVLAGE
jgi:ABC-type lipoprotein export system ATPase subunit